MNKFGWSVLSFVLLPKDSPRLKLWLFVAASLMWTIYSVGCAFYAYRGDPGSHADWLISYSGGFIRRGLMGEVIFITSELSGIPVTWLVVLIQVSMAAIFFFGVAQLLGKVDLTVGTLSLTLAPISIGYFLIDPGAAGRKEILFLALAVVWQSLERASSALGASKFLFAFTLPLVVLSHEGLYFFFPLLVFISILATPRLLSVFELISRGILILLPSTVTLVLVVLVPSTATEEQLCAPLLRAGYATYTCDGALYAAVVGNPDGAISTLAWLENFPTTYLLYFLAMVSFILLCIATFGSEAVSSKDVHLRLIWTGFASLIFVIPLFLVAVDWGRFIHVISASLTIAVLSVSKSRISNKHELTIPLKTLSAVTATFIVLGFTLFGVSVSGGQYRSIVSNLLNFHYYLEGGLTPGIFG